MLGVAARAAHVGEVEARFEPRPAGEVQRRGPRHGVIEGLQAQIERGGQPRGRKPGERGQRAVGLGEGGAGEGDAGAVGVAHGGEERAADHASGRGRHGVDERRQRAFGAVTGRDVYPGEPQGDLRVPGRALQRGQVEVARGVEVTGVGRLVGVTGEIGELQRA